MYKKTKHGVEIDSQAADKASNPRFKGAKPFGKKKARAKKMAGMLFKARKGA